MTAEIIKTILAVAGGSALGGVARWFVSSRCQHILSDSSLFPWGTFIVNIAGCLLIGFIYGLISRGCQLGPMTKLFLTVGFCGGFTTFSTFVHENFLLFGSSRLIMVAVYASFSFAVGLLAVFFGHYIARQM